MVCRHMSPKPQRDGRHSVVAAAAADGADGLGHVATEPEREPGKRAGRCVLTPPDGWCVLTPSEESRTDQVAFGSHKTNELQGSIRLA